MTAFLAVFHIAFRSVHRSHPLRALAALLLLATLLAPSLVAFAFSGAHALAVSGAFGSAAILAPAVALFAGVALAGGDRGGDGLGPILRGSPSCTVAVAAAIAGISAAAAGASALAAVAAAAVLSAAGREFDALACASAVLAACAAAPAAAAAGILLAVVAPRALASALAFLLAAAILSVPGSPAAHVFLLARDAAFGPLPAAAVALSCAASLAAAGAAAAAATALLRAKDLAPAPGDA